MPSGHTQPSQLPNDRLSPEDTPQDMAYRTDSAGCVPDFHRIYYSLPPPDGGGSSTKVRFCTSTYYHRNPPLSKRISGAAARDKTGDAGEGTSITPMLSTALRFVRYNKRNGMAIYARILRRDILLLGTHKNNNKKLPGIRHPDSTRNILRFLVGAETLSLSAYLT